MQAFLGVLVFRPSPQTAFVGREEGGGGVYSPYMGYKGMCRFEGYSFGAVYFGIGYINQRVRVYFQDIDQLVEDFI